MTERRKTKSRFGEAHYPVLKFSSMSVQRDRKIVSNKLIFLSFPVEVADESLARANRKSGLLNSLPILPFLSIVVCMCASVPVLGGGGCWVRILGLLVKNLKIREGEMQRVKQMEGRLVMCSGNALLGLGLEKAMYLYLFFFLCGLG